MLASNNKFTKEERLSLENQIQHLFGTGTSFFMFPFKVLYIHQFEPTSFNKLLISVPKKKFAKSVLRNRIKRLIREAYRNHKSLLAEKHIIGINFALIYVHSEVIEYSEMEKRVILVLQELTKRITSITTNQ
ncbi:MAG: ribonuclease P protein component [Bacteroidota bacterium]|nr:ribonuclease P protein component [Bacteroidota bacterium]